MYWDTILKFNNLKQAHTNTVTIFLRKNILSDSKCLYNFLIYRLNYFEIKKCKLVKNAKD